VEAGGDSWFHDFLDAPISERREKMRRFTRQVNVRIQERGKKVIGGGMKGKAKAKEGVVLVKVRLRAKPEKGTKMTLSPDTKNKAMEAARYGMPIERIAMLCGFSSSETQWARWINANPAFRKELDQARAEGELLLQRKIMSGEANWQAAGWMLERTRGYVARASLEHTGKGGKELSVSGNLLGAFGGQSK
jgi:hypothetical protein